MEGDGAGHCVERGGPQSEVLSPSGWRTLTTRQRGSPRISVTLWDREGEGTGSMAPTRYGAERGAKRWSDGAEGGERVPEPTGHNWVSSEAVQDRAAFPRGRVMVVTVINGYRKLSMMMARGEGHRCHRGKGAAGAASGGGGASASGSWDGGGGGGGGGVEALGPPALGGRKKGNRGFGGKTTAGVWNGM